LPISIENTIFKRLLGTPNASVWYYLYSPLSVWTCFAAQPLWILYRNVKNCIQEGASKRCSPTIISYLTTPAAHQSTSGPYFNSWCICIHVGAKLKGNYKFMCSLKIIKVPGGNRATLRKTEFFHLEMAGKIRTYHGCCLHRPFVFCVWRCKSFPKSLQLSIISAPLRVIWPRSAGNVSSQHFFKACVPLMLFVKAQTAFFFIEVINHPGLFITLSSSIVILMFQSCH
jgi:hypothetical protein